MTDEATLPPPERFRAYAPSEAVRSYVQTDENGPRVNKRGVIIRKEVKAPAEDVFLEADTIDGVADFNSGKTVISRIVFYGGPVESEVVVGSVELGEAGKFAIPCPAEDEDEE